MSATVLHISDDARLVNLLGWILSESGYDVTTSANAEDAMSMSDGLPSPALIIFDGPLNQEKRDATVRLHSAYPEARIIGVHQHNGAARGPHTSAEGHLHKPFHADDLMAVIDEVMSAPVGATSSHRH